MVFSNISFAISEILVGVLEVFFSDNCLFYFIEKQSAKIVF
jgi:hypothetical protein